MDRRKRCKNASVDKKLFIRFQETENGGFRKRISVDRAFVTLEQEAAKFNYAITTDQSGVFLKIAAQYDHALKLD